MRHGRPLQVGLVGCPLLGCVLGLGHSDTGLACWVAQQGSAVWCAGCQGLQLVVADRICHAGPCSCLLYFGCFDFILHCRRWFYGDPCAQKSGRPCCKPHLLFELPARPDWPSLEDYVSRHRLRHSK